MKCKHFYISHDPKAPRACRVYQIKSSSIPSQIVKQANNGAECIGFEAKLQKQNKPKDLNDSRYW